MLLLVLVLFLLLRLAYALLPGFFLQEREEALAELGLKTLRAHKGIVVLGDSGKKRLPIFSFLVRTASSSGRCEAKRPAAQLPPNLSARCCC